jgi:hypothetical protein
MNGRKKIQKTETKIISSIKVLCHPQTQLMQQNQKSLSGILLHIYSQFVFHSLLILQGAIFRITPTETIAIEELIKNARPSR